MDSQLDNLDSTANLLLAWIRQLIYRELPSSNQGQAYARQLVQVVSRAFLPEAKLQPFIALPELCCLGSQGAVQACRPVVAAWSLLMLTAKLLDAVEDGEATEEVPIIINTTTGLHFVIQLVLAELASAGETAVAFPSILLELNQAMLRACAGQHVDLVESRQQEKGLDPDAWFEIAQAKSGDFFAWAAWAGARAANAPENVLACCRTFGKQLGILLQIADDFNDVWLSPQLSDLTVGSPSLPVVYARFVSDKAARHQLDQLLFQARSGDRKAEGEVREVLIEMGAQNFLLVAARTHYLQAVAALEQVNFAPDQHQALMALLDQIMPTINSKVLK